ncbi:hypothetical protein DD238_006242 [Peronospora effusa]|uniref:Uncharacterized protein n=1 Tax=Peronospora effusa TaxID=542832 RepID=A0A3M6VR53_9STRA|nr:hypothetical protein DD238_006242 [Peronospora effusa]
MFISISISFSNGTAHTILVVSYSQHIAEDTPLQELTYRLVSMTSSHSLETGVDIRRQRLDLRRCDRLAVLQPLQRKQTLMLNCIFMIMDDIVQASEYSYGMNGFGHIHYNLSLDDHIILAAQTI